MKYSVIITTTRPRLLDYALRSAVTQDYDDYEVVVSDNSDEGCRELVERIGDARVRYVRPDDHLPLVDHWDSAFAQARGDWHMLLCDDDAVTPNLLSAVDARLAAHSDVESVSWNQGVYIGDAGWGDLMQHRRLGVSPYTGTLTVYDSAALLEDMFASGTGLFRVKWRLPFFPRTAVRRDVLDAIRERQGQLFHRYCPMTSGALATLAFSKRSLHIDLPLRVLGLTVDSCAGWVVDPETMDTSHASPKIELAPIKLFNMMPTAQTDSMLRTQQALPELLGQYEVNYVNYFLACELFIQEIEGQGFDTTVYRAHFDEALVKMPGDVQAATRQAIAAEATTPSAVQRAREAVSRLVARLRPPRLPGEVDAARLGLNDIFDCAAYVGDMIEHRA